MDASRNDLLGELATDAALERTDFLVQATDQLRRFLEANADRLRELGGLTLIDDDPDYLSIAPDLSFRSRSRYLDDETGEWVSETEVIESAAELVELYNPADIYAAFAEAADSWAAGQDVSEPSDEEAAAHRLYDLALTFQERSQVSESRLIEEFEMAAGRLTSKLGDFIVVDDDDERLTLEASGGFRAEVVPEDGDGEWRTLSSAEQLVEFYDPTDVFGDLADALAEAFPSVAPEYDGEASDAEAAEDGDRA